MGELAHIIPASVDGPRGKEGAHFGPQDRADPENVIVLCPTCHTVVDKDPSTYPASTLRAWKSLSQRLRALTFGTPTFSSRAEARAAVEPLLVQNATAHELYGPLPDVFDDARADQWKRQTAKVIIPNNSRLLAIANANRRLLSVTEVRTIGQFTIHAEDLRSRHEETDWTPGSSTFPPAMARIFLDDETASAE